MSRHWSDIAVMSTDETFATERLDLQLLAEVVKFKNCAPRLHNDGQPESNSCCDRRIVWIEIRFCTPPVLDKSCREATMGRSPTLPQGVESG